MEIQELEIAIAPDGTVTCKVRGVKGQSCLDLTKDLEADLGGKILVRERTWEMGVQGKRTRVSDRIKCHK
jgi:hypothetical protein